MDRRKKKILRGLFGFLLLSVLFLLVQNSHLFQSFEQQTIDLRYRFFNRQTPFPKNVIIVDVDDESLKNMSSDYGRWPWPRRVYKDVIEFISLGSPAAIVFDFLFTEEQKNSADDALLGEISNQFPNVSHGVLLLKQSTEEGKEFNPLEAKTKELFQLKIDHPSFVNSPQFAAKLYRDFLLPNNNLYKQLHLLHAVNVEADHDGILRRVPLLIPYGDAFVPSLAFRGLLSLIPNHLVKYTNNGLQILENGKVKWNIPLDQQGYLQLHYYDSHFFPEIYRVAELIESYGKIQKGTVEDPALLSINPELFKDKIVLIGTSAKGLSDLKVTPLENQYPGVFLHATAIANMLSQDFLHKPQPYLVILITILIIFIIEFFIFSFDSLLVRNIMSPLLLIIYLASCILIFKFKSFYLPMAHPLLFGFLALIDGYIYLGLVEGRARKKMETTLAKYLSPNVTKHLIASGVDPTAEVGTTKELTVLFSDIRGFTTLSENMEPAKLVHLLNEYLSKMTDIVFDHDGTLDKFIGDAIMAFWGAPLDDAEHPLHAVQTGIHMLRVLKQLNAKWAHENLPQLKIGIGILTGPVIVGNIGGAKRIDYTVIGDNVNTTSRIEGLTKEYQCGILISETTYEKVKDHFIIRILDSVVAKGKTKSLRIYEPLIEKSSLSLEASQSEALARQFDTNWSLYFNGSFKEALAGFEKLFEEFPDDGPTKVYIDRCKYLILHPPSEWTGVFVATRK